MAIQALFKASDGKIFESMDAALDHEKTLINKEKLHDEVKDLMNQLLIKLEFVPSAVVRHQEDEDSYTGYSYRIVNVPTDERLLKKLASIKKFCELTLENDWGATEMIEKYYDSTCY